MREREFKSEIGNERIQYIYIYIYIYVYIYIYIYI